MRDEYDFTNAIRNPYDADLDAISEAIDTLAILEEHVKYVYKGKRGKKQLINLVSKESGSALQITLTNREYELLKKYIHNEEKK